MIPPTMRPTRRHLLLAGAVLMLFGIALGLFLRWVAQTPRLNEIAQKPDETHEPGKDPEPTDRLTVDSVADFGKVEPLAAFPTLEMPALPAPKQEEKPKTEDKPPPTKPDPKKEPEPKKPPPARIDTVPAPPVAVPPQSPPATWRLKAGDSFLQELIVSQSPTFRTQGLVFTSSLRYSVVSRFVVEQATPAGAVVVQRVEGSRLIQADATTQGLVLPALAKMPGTTFRMQFGPNMEMVRFVGQGPALLVGGGAFAGGFGLQTASLLDLDGWREMAQATFFQPAPGLTPRTSWARPMVHNWGPLGGWVGQTLFVYSGRQGNLHQFSYGHRMNYVAPRGGGAGLPFQVAGAAFQPQVADGTIVFDAERGRVQSGQERFRVVGRINIVILGQPAPVDIEEEQMFQFRLVDVTR